MKQKGFTLAELMGVIIILSVILLLTLPTIDKTIKNAKQTAYDAQIDEIKQASSDWALKNTSLLPSNEGDSITVYLGELKLQGNIDVNVKDPKTGKIMSNNTSVVITKASNKYGYVVNVVDIAKNESRNTPLLVIDGDIIDYVEVNQEGIEYTIPNVTAKTSNGIAIDNSYVSYQILQDGNTVTKVDTSKLGTYTINYTVTYDGVSGNYQKTVIVRDTTEPVITIDGSMKIKTTKMGVSLLTGVTINDNSGETITPTIKSNISNIPGNYTVYYTVKDSSGNTTTKKRDVEVYTPEIIANGTVYYFNPVTGLKCTDYVSSNSNTGVKTGCMKWYAFGDTEDNTKIKLLLDHNTTAATAWDNSSRSESTVSTNPVTPGSEEMSSKLKKPNIVPLANYVTIYYTTNGPLIALAKLKADTEGWTGVDSLTSKYTYTNKEGSYTINYSGYRAQLMAYNDIVSIAHVASSGYYFQNNTATNPNLSTGTATYKWLFNNTDGCTSYGCDTEQSGVTGYWTETAKASDYTTVWNVTNKGTITNTSVGVTEGITLIGIRPVITVLKTAIK